MINSLLFLSLLAVFLAALFSYFMTWAIRPVLLRHALARPDARSSHRVPTPQGAGIAVITATLVIAGTLIALAPDMKIPFVVFGATMFVAAVGFADDMNSIPVLPRLLLQGLAVGAVIFATPEDLRIVPAYPLWIERGLTFLAGLWFVNLVNFMDGLDLLTAAETVPIATTLVLLGSTDYAWGSTTIVAAALGGAMLGFAPFNRPVAKVFLGDVGSLPVGLLLGWGLLEIASHHQLVAALLLPLYYLSDATLTLLVRTLKGEQPWMAHRSHFYQRATDNGFTVVRVVSEVFALNVGLASLAILSTITLSTSLKILCLCVGAIAVALLMHRFAKPRGVS